MIPFYFADRFSGAVVHLTTTGQRERCLASYYLNETVTGDRTNNASKNKMPASTEPIRAFQRSIIGEVM
ncbi:MAG: hypothetical protein ACI9ZF_003684 [Bradyrhizobium sp.]